jgi:acyl transferase domain-containing protein/pimeloyl-ACP methyl ester carboxylesterase/NAD(P)-dependent dehydrogenase (short-subunit alcohol dehydrogenase family)
MTLEGSRIKTALPSDATGRRRQILADAGPAAVLLEPERRSMPSHESSREHAVPLVETLTLHRDDAVVRDHRVHGVPILPGVAFLDLIHRALAKNRLSPRSAELSNLLFEEPLAVPDGERDVQVSLFERGAEQPWRVEVTSHHPGGDDVARSVLHLSAELRLGANPVRPPPIDVERLKAQALERLDLEVIYGRARDIGIVHGDFMRGLGQWYLGKDFLLAEMRLGNDAVAYVDDFDLHPALLDCSTFCPLYFHPKDPDVPYIPIHIEAFRAFGRLGGACYAYVQRPVEVGNSLDVLSHSYSLFDAQGNAAASFQRITAKRVRSKAGLIKSPARVVPAANLPAPPAGQSQTLLEAVKGLIQEKLGRAVTPQEEGLGFYEMGLDSGQLLAIVRSLEARLERQLYPTLLFEYSTAVDLAAYLQQEFGEGCLSVPATAAEPETAPAQASPPSLLLLEAFWKAQPAPVVPRPRPAGAGTLLLFTGAAEEEHWRAVARSSPHWAHLKPIAVRPGPSFKQLASDLFEIDPRAEADYGRLLREASAQHAPPALMVHDWTSSDGEVGTEFSFAGGEPPRLPTELLSMHSLYRALVRLEAGTKATILYLYPLRGGLPIHASHAAIAAYARTLALEDPRFSCQVVGVEGHERGRPFGGDSARDSALLLEAAVTTREELRHTEGGPQVVRWREATGIRSESPLRRGGTYLITGGGGGLGLRLAEHLIERWHARVALVGRSSLDEPRREQLERIGGNGRQLAYFRCDVSSLSETEALVRGVKDRWGKINGVFHAAGTLRDGLLVGKTLQDMEQVLAPKVYGAVNLDRVLEAEPLDLFVLFSSTAAALGNPGQGDYAFANGFLDQFAWRREDQRRRGLRTGRTLSVNWGLWEGGGMTVGEEQLARLRETSGLAPIPVAAGMAALERCLTSGAVQCMVVAGDEIRLRRALVTPSEHARPELPGTIGAPALTVTSPAAARPSRASGASVGLADAIAIVGIQGRFPMAADLEQFWENLRQGRDCIQEIPRERWDLEQFFSADRNVLGKTSCRWGGFIEDVDKFDALFFNISPREAEAMDPQERLFLETVWKTLEDAGHTRRTLKDERVGTFVGVMWGEYPLLARQADAGGAPPMSNFASIANRASYFFNFRGPSLAIDTMCSSSLMAIHLACESIRRGESTMAIAGGVNLSLHPGKYLHLSRAGLLSSKGHCRSFGAGGDGYVPGEGVGAVLLKPLDRAQHDGDNIHAVIRATGANHGGRSAGYAVPNQRALGELAERTLLHAGIDPASIGCLEASGTGTSLGDAVEFNALTQAFTRQTHARGFCSLGSVKSNIGHLESAAGIAAVAKVVLQLKHGALAPSLHADPPNPALDFSRSPFHLQDSFAPWPAPAGSDPASDVRPVRRAAINLFGAGGANVHVILEEHFAGQQVIEQTPDPQLVVVSARSAQVLRAYAADLLAFVRRERQASAAIASPLKAEPPASALRAELAETIARLVGPAGTTNGASEDLGEWGWGPFHAAALANHLMTTRGASPPVSVLALATSLTELAGSIERQSITPTAAAGSSAAAAVAVQGAGQALLGDLAHTLQIGREEMDWRLATVVSSLAELEQALGDFVEGSPGPSLVVGQASSEGAAAPETSTRIEAALQQRDLVTLARCWVAGGTIDWSRLGGTQRRRISLPTYRFVRERHWLSDSEPVDQKPARAVRSINRMTARPASKGATVEGAEGERVRLIGHLQELVGDLLKLAPDRIEAHRPLSDYGLDSIFQLKLLESMQATFGDLPQSFLVENETLERQAARLISLGLSEPRVLASADSAEATSEPVVAEQLVLLDVLPMGGHPEDTDRCLEQLAKPDRTRRSPSDLLAASVGELLATKPARTLINVLVNTPTSGNLEIVSSGNGAPLLLIPGLGLSARAWSRQIHDWSSGWRTLVVHPPGVGQSEVGNDLSLTATAHAFAEALRALNLTRPVHVVGSSFGGMIGQALAQAHPELVASLTLACSFWEIRPEDGGSFLDKIRKDFELVEQARTEAGGEARAEQHPPLFNRFLDGRSINAGMEKVFGHLMSGVTSTWDLLPGILCPTLVLAGSGDIVHPVAESRELRERVSNARLAEITGAGHVPNLTHPDEFERQVLPFIHACEQSLAAARDDRRP